MYYGPESLWDPNVHDRVYNSLPLVTILIEINPFRYLQYYIKIKF
jgi:hypothetical protein